MRDSQAAGIISNNIAHKKSLVRLFIYNFLFLAINIVIICTITGCSQQVDSESAWINRMYPSHNSHLANYNPNFVFDPPCARPSRPYISSEVIGRSKWPASPEAIKHVSSGNVVTYRERYYSDQYLNSSNVPQERFHRRVYGERQRYSYR